MLISTKTLTGTVVAFGLAMGCASNPPAAQPQPAPQKPSQAKLDEVRANAQRAFEDPSFGGSSQPTSSDEAARAAEAASEPTRPERAPAPAPSAPQPEAREDNSAVLLRAEGVGSSEATAQKAALAELSRLVVVEIESQFEASQSYSDGKTKSEVTDVNKVASKGYFSGIKYVTKNESSGRITVEAQLTQKRVPRRPSAISNKTSRLIFSMKRNDVSASWRRRPSSSARSRSCWAQASIRPRPLPRASSRDYAASRADPN